MITFRFILLYSLLFSFYCLKTPLSLADNVSLDSYLEHVSKSSEELQAVELDIQSLQLEIEAREIELSPTLDLEVTRFWDNRPSLSTNQQSTGIVTEASLSKPLATGTSLNLLSGIETAEYRTASRDEDNLLNWQLSVTQSLWQNSFGHQTRLRRQRDQNELRSRLLTLMQDKQDILIEFELLYWEIAYAREEVKVREENLERSRRMLSWIQERYDRSAAEHVDLLQGQTLVASRELQLQLASDNLKTSQTRLNEKLQLNAEFVPDYEDLQKERELSSLPADVEFAPSIPILIETLQSQAEADFLKATSRLEADKLKPIFDIGYSYGQQGLDTSFSTARDQAFSSGNDYHEIGAVFSMPLDFFLVSQSRKSKDVAAQAEQLRSAKFRRQSDLQWKDLERTIREQKQRVQTAMNLAKLQQDKSEEEHVRFEKGRTTAFQAISFEQEAAESQLLVVQLLAQLRRTEAQARVFVKNTNGVK